ncbi:NAD(P)H-binding protein [Tsukamurella sp. 8F]|uniref:NAD(P)-dependent oxidoreductase n=1 Tax=Tsukamurella sp. 8F TaxID=3031961 RepID=UPI0023B9D792|nr:NAD(P)H-binding protein [Tsukamurella sp. 8F]MDF0588609.1 NAD(P)H-binding protein [Tsukamurella sp. 8F]
MKVVVFGASGYSGGNIVAELRSRGIDTVAVSRSGGDLVGDVTDADFVAKAVDGADVVVSALPTRAPAGSGPELPTALASLVAGIRTTGARLAVVGGAGSLRVGSEDGPRLVDTPSFPDEVKPIALEHDRALDYLRELEGIDWFYLSPAASYGSFNPGERTGAYRIGGEVLLADADGDSEISGADYAAALVDEIVVPRHRNARFSVAY